MAKRRRRRGETPQKEVDEKSKNFFYLLAAILGLGVLGFIALNMM